MKKFGIFVFIIILSSIIAGLYGSIHNQVTYTISPEYFTKFKYDQFGFYPEWFGGHRNTVAVVGFFASWWTGFIAGAVLGITGLMFPNRKGVFRGIMKALLITVLVAIVFGFLGFVYALIVPVSENTPDSIPKNVLNKENFSLAGTVHNFSYVGGLFGLIIAGGYQIVQNRKQNRHIHSEIQQDL